MAAVLSLAFVLFGGMIFFAVCGMLIERWCEEEHTDSRPDASHHQSLKRGAKKKPADGACPKQRECVMMKRS